MVGPGRAVEAALLTPLQAEGLAVHPDHMHRRGALLTGAWHGEEDWAAPGGSAISLSLVGEFHRITGLRQRRGGSGQGRP